MSALARANLGFYRVDYQRRIAMLSIFHRHWAKISEDRLANSCAVENFLQYPEAVDS